jgi:hypothetical protein
MPAADGRHRGAGGTINLEEQEDEDAVFATTAVLVRSRSSGVRAVARLRRAILVAGALAISSLAAPFGTALAEPAVWDPSQQ